MARPHSHHSLSHSSSYNRAFAISIALNMGFVIVQATYGILSNSLALLADAGHNLSDVLGLLLAWGASFLASREPTERHTYGWGRTSIWAAFLNATFIFIACGGLVWEAVQRLREPADVVGTTVAIVAGVGIVVNTVSAFLFWSAKDNDLNIKGAFLHLAADAAVSVGVAIAGIAVTISGWNWLDPAVSLVVVVAIAAATWRLFRESIELELDAVPPAIDPLAVKTYLAERPGVEKIHDLHIWAMSTAQTALTVHLVMPSGYPGDAFLQEIQSYLKNTFGIDHATIQIEMGDPNYHCLLASDDRV